MFLVCFRWLVLVPKIIVATCSHPIKAHEIRNTVLIMDMKRFSPKRDGYSWCYTLFTFITVVLGFVFFITPAKDVMLSDVELVDGPYITLLKHKYLETNIPIGKKVSLETLGSQKTYTATQTGNHFGLSSRNSAMDSLFTNTHAENLLKNIQFTGLKSGVVKLASPLWAYEHNLHLHDANYCSDTDISSAMDYNRLVANQINPVLPSSSQSVAQNVYKFAPAYPTTIDYNKCYSDHEWHRVVVGFYVIPAAFLWMICTALYINRAMHPTNGIGLTYTPYAQQISFVCHTLAIAFISVAVSTGFPTFDGDTSRCPEKMTGLSTAYEILITVYVMLFAIVLMHFGSMIIEIFFPSYLGPEYQFQAPTPSDEETSLQGDRL